MATKSSQKPAAHHKDKKDKRLLEEASSVTGKVERETYEAHRKVHMAEVLTSGDPKRIEKYFIRRWAYRTFNRFMNRVMRHV
jgi:hypothetical protein